MEQYINKVPVVAEIDRRVADNKKEIERASYKYLEGYFEGYEDALVMFKKFLNTLEVREVDLIKEAERFVQTKEFVESTESPVILIAKHFFELGMAVSNKAQKGE